MGTLRNDTPLATRGSSDGELRGTSMPSHGCAKAYAGGGAYACQGGAKRARDDGCADAADLLGHSPDVVKDQSSTHSRKRVEVSVKTAPAAVLAARRAAGSTDSRARGVMGDRGADEGEEVMPAWARAMEIRMERKFDGLTAEINHLKRQTEGLTEKTDALAAKTDALAAKTDRISHDLAQLASRVDAIESRLEL